jgi:hypothetical protein
VNTNNSPLFSLCLGLWVVLAMAATLSLGWAPMGMEAARSTQSWWTARRFQQAEADQDFLGMRDLGVRYLAQTGDGTPLDFAIYSVGFAASGPSMNRLPADALDWALVGAATAEAYLDKLPAPWATLQTQAHILVERAFPLSNDPVHLASGLRALEMWLASGGGLWQRHSLPSGGATHHSTATTSAYQAYVGTPRPTRPAFLLQRMSGESDDEKAE